ncbi:MAG: peptide-methionine (S)-S-oxide reductase MsrA [Solirubrobacterales bacterium]
MVEDATFAAGCFWQVEIDFANTPGVLSTEVGYTGGKTESPSYEEVCGGTTGHAEAVHLTFDPEQVSYEQLLEKFFSLHDPTQLNRQGPDVGHQYRSAIFFHSPEQEREAIAAKERAGAGHRDPVVTEVVAAEPFWPAEDYHQRYLEKRGMATCRVPSAAA